MEVSKTESKEGPPKTYVIVSFIKEPKAAFDQPNWPVHTTIFRPFTSNLSETDLSNLLDEIASRYIAIPIRGKAREYFGPNQTVPVTELETSNSLQELHDAVRVAYEARGAQLVGRAFPTFRPHITDQREGSFAVGEDAHLTSMSLVRMDGENRQVIHTATLGS
jgi:2'-5' RNA ligase